MTSASALRTGKGHRDENFPVASRLIHPRHRGPILAFYEFVRTADDVADHPTLPEAEKLALLDQLEATLIGKSDNEPAGMALRSELDARKLTPLHAQDLLTAFRLDVTKRRYQNWGELIDYCSCSAMPVGRFVLDVHGENRATWVASDMLCAALQIINHLQDCGADYRDLDRVYIPLDVLAAAGAKVEDLALAQASPALRSCLLALALRTKKILDQGAALPAQVDDLRLSLEVSLIETYARRLTGLLSRRDPLSERVHLGRAGLIGFGLTGLVQASMRRLWRTPSSRKPQDA